MPTSMLPSAASRLGVTALTVLTAAGATWLATPSATAAPGDGADIRIHNERAPFGVSKDDPVVCRFYLDAANFGEVTSVAYTIQAQPPLPTAATVSGTITLAGGAGHTDVLGLADGQYRLVWTVAGGTGPREKVFRVDCSDDRRGPDGQGFHGQGPNGPGSNGPGSNGPGSNGQGSNGQGPNGQAATGQDGTTSQDGTSQDSSGRTSGRGEDPGRPIEDRGESGSSSGRGGDGPKGGVHAGGGGLVDTARAYTPLSAAAAVGLVVVSGAVYIRLIRRRSHGAA